MRFVVDYTHGLGRMMRLEIEEAKKYGFEIVEVNKKVEQKKEPKQETKPRVVKEEVVVEKQKVVNNIFSVDDFEPKPEFYNEVIKFLSDKGFEFLEEIQTDKKEVVGKVKIPSSLGSIVFLFIAKNKKTVSKDEISSSVQRATHGRMPCLVIIRKQPTKAIQKFVEENNLVKILVLK